MKPENLSRVKNAFSSGLKARGVERGIRAEKKAESGDLFIYDEIGANWFGEGVTAKSVAEQLDALKGVKTLNVYINSPGGSVWDGKAIHAQLSRFEATKNVYVDGIAASAASFIAMAGDSITMAPGATMMVHEAMGGAFGYADDLEATAEVLRLETKNIAGIYAKRTGCSMEECLSMMADETWMDAAKAKEMGFCDSIAEEEDEDAPEDLAAVPVLAAIAETQKRPGFADVKRSHLLNRFQQNRSAASRDPATASRGATKV